MKCAYEPCSQEFTPSMKSQKYCCPTCNHRAAERRRLNRKAAKVAAEFGDVECGVCHKIVPRTKGRLQKTCLSENCVRIWRDKLHFEGGPNPPDKFYDNITAEEARDLIGAPQYKPGKRLCNMCGEEFDSWDVRKNRTCPKCSGRNKIVYTGSLVGSGRGTFWG